MMSDMEMEHDRRRGIQEAREMIDDSCEHMIMILKGQGGRHFLTFGFDSYYEAIGLMDVFKAKLIEAHAAEQRMARARAGSDG